MATERVRVIKVDTEVATKSVRELRKELRELRSTMLSCEEGTEEYNKALVEAAGIQHTLKEQMEEINASAMDFGQITGNVVKATGGIVAGFQAATAAMSLFGIENEDVIKSMQKMQSLMAITQAIPAIDDAIKGFNRLGLAIKGATAGMSRLKIALMSTGIGAAVVAVGLLAANWDKVTGAMKRWGIIGEDTEAKLKEQKKKVAELRKELAKLEGDYEKWQKEEKYDKLNDNAKKQYEELAKQIENYRMQLEIMDKREEERNNRQEGDLGELGQGIYQSSESLRDLIYQLERQQDAILANDKNYKQLNKTITDNTKLVKENKEVKDTFIDDAYAEIDYNKAINKDYEESKEALEDLLYIQEQELATLEKGSAAWYQLSVQIENTKKSIADYGKSDDVKSNDNDSAPQEAVNLAEQISIAINASALALNEFSDNPAWGNILKNVATLAANWDKMHENIKSGGKKAFTAYAQIAATGLSAIGTMLNGLADEQDETNKQGFESQKNLQAAGATMNMLAGIVSAWASAMQLGPVAGPVMGSILSAMMLATGIANIVKIKQQKFESGSTSASSASATPSAAGTFVAPVQYTQEVNSANIEGAIKDSRVYVLESDITNTQNKVEVSENESRY